MADSDDIYSAATFSDDVEDEDDDEHEDEEDDVAYYDNTTNLMSPTDGYFGPATGPNGVNRGFPYVPNVWVRDPSLPERSTAASKAEEAAQESSSAAAGGTNHQLHQPATVAQEHQHPPSTPSSQAGHSRVTSTASARYTPSSSSYTRSQQPGNIERSSLTPTDAPPAYTPNPSTSNSPQTGPAGSYRTFFAATNSMGRAEEARPLLAGQPESMGGSGDSGADPSRKTWVQRIKRRVPFGAGERPWFRTILHVVILTLLIVVLIVSLLRVAGHWDSDDQVSNPPPSSGMDPSRPYPPFDGGIDFSYRNCKDARHQYPIQSFPVTFAADRQLKLRQDIQNDRPSDSWSIHVRGDVIFRRQTSGDSPSGIIVEMLSNDKNMDIGVTYDADAQYLHIQTPRSISWEDGSGSSDTPCLTIRATVWVPENAELNNVDVQTVHLGIKLLDNLSLRMVKNIRLQSTVGELVSATSGDDDNKNLMHDGAPTTYKLDSRNIELKTTSASIRGSWPLYDSLNIESTSGHISVGVEPKPVLKENPKPASLWVKATSGHVELWEPISRLRQAASENPEDVLPPRDYRVEIETASGDTRGSLAFTTLAKHTSYSGKLDLALLPVFPSNPAAAVTDQFKIDTSSTSGTSKISVLEPMWVDIGAARGASSRNVLNVLSSRHTSTSASIFLQYPAAWEGEFELGTLSGDLAARGKDVKITRSGKQWPGVKNVLEGNKGGGGGGEEGSKIRAKTTSGDIKLVFPA